MMYDLTAESNKMAMPEMDNKAFRTIRIMKKSGGDGSLGRPGAEGSATVKYKVKSEEEDYYEVILESFDTTPEPTRNTTKPISLNIPKSGDDALDDFARMSSKSK